MMFDKNTFYDKLNFLLAEHNFVNIERFMLDQIDMIRNSVFAGQSCCTCDCGYGSFEGDNRLGKDDKEHQWLEERTYEIVTVLNELACFYRDTNKFDKAIETFLKAESEMDRNGMVNTYDYLQIVMNKAGVYRVTGEYGKALEEFKRAENMLNEADNKDYYTSASLYNNIALVYQDLKDFNMAIECLKKAVTYIRKVENKKDELAVGLNNLAMAYYSVKKFKEADAAINESLLIFKELGDENNPYYPGTLNTKAMFCYYSNDLGKAAEIFEQAIEKTEKIFGKNRDYISGCRNCSYTYEKLGNKEKAQRYRKMAEDAVHSI